MRETAEDSKNRLPAMVARKDEDFIDLSKTGSTLSNIADDGRIHTISPLIVNAIGPTSLSLNNLTTADSNAVNTHNASVTNIFSTESASYGLHSLPYGLVLTKDSNSLFNNSSRSSVLATSIIAGQSVNHFSGVLSNTNGISLGSGPMTVSPFWSPSPRQALDELKETTTAVIVKEVGKIREDLPDAISNVVRKMMAEGIKSPSSKEPEAIKIRTIEKRLAAESDDCALVVNSIYHIETKGLNAKLIQTLWPDRCLIKNDKSVTGEGTNTPLPFRNIASTASRWSVTSIKKALDSRINDRFKNYRRYSFPISVRRFSGQRYQLVINMDKVGYDNS